jgi:hypothetical protein
LIPNLRRSFSRIMQSRIPLLWWTLLPELKGWIRGRIWICADMSRKKYQETLECQGINLANTTYLYARFTTTVLCGQMVQESISPCGLTQAQSYVLFKN